MSGRSTNKNHRKDRELECLPPSLLRDISIIGLRVALVSANGVDCDLQADEYLVYITPTREQTQNHLEEIQTHTPSGGVK